MKKSFVNWENENRSVDGWDLGAPRIKFSQRGTLIKFLSVF